MPTVAITQALVAQLSDPQKAELRGAAQIVLLGNPVTGSKDGVTYLLFDDPRITRADLLVGRSLLAGYGFDPADAFFIAPADEATGEDPPVKSLDELDFGGGEE